VFLAPQNYSTVSCVQTLQSENAEWMLTGGCGVCWRWGERSTDSWVL